ncbi:MAG: MBOAT family protein [Clostridia bacterium]|nr:MBOAT family protein [Clostridia bacterium]
MVFSSAIFLFIFLPLIWLGHRLLPSVRAKNILLSVASLLFYAFGEPIYVVLMVLSVAVNYAAARCISEGEHRRRLPMILAVLFDLAMLGVFKYAGFAVECINYLPFIELPVPAIRLPIGISFFTFQILSYVVDVYRGDTQVQTRIDDLFLYIAFFPQLIAGPIVKYHDIAAQITDRTMTPELTARGLRRFLFGLSKKLLISNPCGLLADTAFAALGEQTLGAPLGWLGAIAYCFQIYYDFSGYSDMAIGLGHMFGFHILENFNYPYISGSIREFWRRWHISLSTWFREYVYIPLGGNRRGRGRTVLNKFIVFFTTGLWHGASLNFIVWGLFHGTMQMIEEFIRPTERRWLRPLWRVVTLAAVCLSFVVFRADNMTDAVRYLAVLFGGGASGGLSAALALLDPYTLTILAAALIFSFPIVPILRKRAEIGPPALDYIGYAVTLGLLLLCVMSLASSTYNPFIYFRF